MHQTPCVVIYQTRCVLIRQTRCLITSHIPMWGRMPWEGEGGTLLFLSLRDGGISSHLQCVNQATVDVAVAQQMSVSGDEQLLAGTGKGYVQLAVDCQSVGLTGD